MDLVARIILPVQAGKHARKPADHAFRFAQALFAAEHRFQGKKPKSLLLAAAFAAERVGDFFAQHLKSAAYAEHGHASVRRRYDLLRKSARF